MGVANIMVYIQFSTSLQSLPAKLYSETCSIKTRSIILNSLFYLVFIYTILICILYVYTLYLVPLVSVERFKILFKVWINSVWRITDYVIIPLPLYLPASSPPPPPSPPPDILVVWYAGVNVFIFVPIIYKFSPQGIQIRGRGWVV